jgi:hypothetical protein
MMSSSCLDNGGVRVISGLRPKKKPTSTVVGQTAPVGGPPTIKPSTKSAGVNNPWDHLCEKLLKSDDFVNVIPNQHSSLIIGMDILPKSYNSHQEYIQAWEPLLVEEIKSSIFSNIPTSTTSSKRRGGTMIASVTDFITPPATSPQSMRLTCEFTPISSQPTASHSDR